MVMFIIIENLFIDITCCVDSVSPTMDYIVLIGRHHRYHYF